MESIWIAIGGIAVAAIPSIISALVIRRINKHEAMMDKRDKEKARYEYLCLSNLNAIAGVSKELYVCVQKGRTPNGELDDAFNYMQDTKHKLEEHLREMAAKSS